ncbi:protease prsW family [Leptolinea tardivitalis]|nr:protease prsW family [Leptolinea tardivitalis]
MLLLSGGGAFLAFMSAAGFAVGGLMTCLKSSTGMEDAQVLFSLASTAFLIFVLLLPSTVMAAMRLMGIAIPEWRRTWFFKASRIGMFLVPIAILFGYLVSSHVGAATILFPLFQLIVVGLPIWWLIETGKHDLPPSSAQHNWGILSISLTTTMPLIVVVELILVVCIVAGVVFCISFFSPDVLQQLSTTLDRLVNAGIDRETVLRIIRPYTSKPSVILLLIAIASGIIPLLEELLKPLALWFFSNRQLTPREGFIGGMICGAGFALLESLGALANPSAESWVVIATGRVGTGILHITATGLVGWGLARAWTDGKYGSLIGAYLAAFCFHSLWNASALMTGFRELAQFAPIQVEVLDGFIQASPFILVMLAIFMVSVILRANTIFRKEQNNLNEF